MGRHPAHLLRRGYMWHPFDPAGCTRLATMVCVANAKEAEEGLIGQNVRFFRLSPNVLTMGLTGHI